jgi:hypothetical protein
MMSVAVQKFLHSHVDLCRLIGCVNIIGPLGGNMTVEIFEDDEDEEFVKFKQKLWHFLNSTRYRLLLEQVKVKFVE